MIDSDNTIILTSILASALIAALSIMRTTLKPPPKIDEIEPIPLNNRDEILAMIEHELTVKLATIYEGQLLNGAAHIHAPKDGSEKIED